MLKRTTILLSALLFFLVVGPVWAQTEVTVRQLNALPDGNVDALNAIDDDPDGLIGGLITPALIGDTLVVTVVVLTDPLNSGLASWVAANNAPGRIHIFARDTSAVRQGFEGMGLQIVDANFATTGSINLLIGDVIRVTGTISFFGTAMQFTAITIEPQGAYGDFGIADSILDPVTITTADLNVNKGPLVNQSNWTNYESLIHQYVRIENATILRRTLAPSGRPNWNFSTDGGETFTQNDDLSLRFRNDRGGIYQPPFNVLDPNDPPFEPPPVGSNVNVQGFVVFRGAFETFDFVGLPQGAFLQVTPFADSDLEVTALPNVRGVAIAPLTEVPGDAALTVTVDLDADAGAVASVTATWTNATTGATDTVAFTAVDDSTYSGDIPAQADGDFVSFSVSALNTDGIEFQGEPGEVSYRVLFEGINEIADIQATVDGGEGDSPFVGLTTDMSISGVVQNKPDSSGFLIVQDDDTLAPWSGIAVELSDSLSFQQGDRVTITRATIAEIRGIRFDRGGDLTGLNDPVMVKGDPGMAFGYKTMTTDMLQDAGAAEAHESMMLTFDDAIIVNANPDSPSNFGEFAISSDGTTDNQIRVDDASSGFPFSFNGTIAVWERLDFVQGVWANSFGQTKLLPEDLSDIGDVINVATEEEGVPETFVLHQNYPNPFNPATAIRYEIGRLAQVKLEVFDVLGRRVATLVETQQAPGAYTVTFDARRLSSGLYLYRLEAGSKVEIKQMILLK